MTVITSFTAKRREKQWKWERTILKEITLNHIHESVMSHFGSVKVMGGKPLQESVVEGCYDVAIEAYLLGAQFSHLIHRGEKHDAIEIKSISTRKHITDTLYNFWLYWAKIGDHGGMDESIYFVCEPFVDHWYKEGVEKGTRRLKLRLR